MHSIFITIFLYKTVLKLKFCEAKDIVPNADILPTTFCVLIEIKVQQNQIMFLITLLLLLKGMEIFFRERLGWTTCTARPSRVSAMPEP